MFVERLPVAVALVEHSTGRGIRHAMYQVGERPWLAFVNLRKVSATRRSKVSVDSGLRSNRTTRANCSSAFSTQSEYYPQSYCGSEGGV